MKKKRLKRIAWMLCMTTVFVMCACGNKKEVNSSGYQPTELKLGGERTQYQYRTHNIEYSEFSMKGASLIDYQIPINLLEDKESYFYKDAEKGAYYIVRSLRFSPITQETEFVEWLTMKNRGNDSTEDEKTAKTIEGFQMYLYNTTGLISLAGDTYNHEGHSYKNKEITYTLDNQKDIVIDYVLEFDLTDDQSRNGRQTQQIEEEQLKKAIESGCLKVDVSFTYENGESYKRGKYFKITPDEDFQKFTLEAYSTSSESHKKK